MVRINMKRERVSFQNEVSRRHKLIGYVYNHNQLLCSPAFLVLNYIFTAFGMCGCIFVCHVRACDVKTMSSNCFTLR